MPDSTYDICIAGTGAAGGILAHQLAKSGLRVLSLESGPELPADYFTDINPPGLEKWRGIRKKTRFPPEHEDALFIHDLFAEAAHRSSDSDSETCFRQFQIHALDGLQNLWNGVCVRFGAEDFKSWPIRYEDLAPWYTQVEKLITVCGIEENLNHVPDGHFVPPKPMRPADRLIIKAFEKLDNPDFQAIANRKAIETRAGKDNHCISTGICTYGCPVGAMYKFSSRLLPEIRPLANYELRLNARVTRVVREKGGKRITALEYLDTQTLETHWVHADTFVLSAGAIETPRLLMNSFDEDFPQGLANSSATLGQNLQDNPKVVLATSLYKLWFHKKPDDIGYGDLLLLLGKSRLDNGESFPFIGHSISAPPDIPYYLKSISWMPKVLKKPFVKMVYNSFMTLGLFCEGDVLADNCVKPSRQSDCYGIRQVTINYRSSEATLEKMQKMAQFGRKILRNASATQITEDHSNDGTGIHYAGTCRMGSDPGQSIVDENLKTFDHDNLYLCDGSVIPRLPDKHLTLTIMALAARLANHLVSLKKSEHYDKN